MFKSKTLIFFSFLGAFSVLIGSVYLLEKVEKETFFIYQQPSINYDWGEVKIHFLNINTISSAQPNLAFSVGLKFEFRHQYLQENCRVSVNEIMIIDPSGQIVKHFDGKIKGSQKLVKKSRHYNFIFHDTPISNQDYNIEVTFSFSENCDFEQKSFSEKKILRVRHKNGLRRIELLMAQ